MEITAYADLFNMIPSAEEKKAIAKKISEKTMGYISIITRNEKKGIYLHVEKIEDDIKIHKACEVNFSAEIPDKVIARRMLHIDEEESLSKERIVLVPRALEQYRFFAHLPKQTIVETFDKYVDQYI